MAQPWIVQSKLLPPGTGAGVLPRERLWPASGLPPAMVLLAGPGGGKTLALAALARGKADGGSAVWLSLDDDDADVATFFHYLVAATRRHVPPFGEEVEALLAGRSLDARLLWQRYFGALASYNLPQVTVAIDDLHHLVDGCPALVQELIHVLDKLPAGICVLLSSRKRLGVPMSRLRARGALVVLEQDDLRFTPAETTALLESRAPGGLVPEERRERALALDGWPLGVALVAAGATAEGDGDEEWLSFVAEELFQAQLPERQAFMLKTVLLPELELEACRALAPDAAVQLAGLEADLLVERVGQGYRYPGHLRAFLEAEAARTVLPSEREAWHRQAAHHYQQAGRLELALPLLLAARAWDEAVRLCLQVFPPMRYDGRLAVVGRWLQRFPAEVREKSAPLQLWVAHEHSRRGEGAEALAAYDRARKLYWAAEDASGEFKVLVCQASLAVVDQDLKKANQLMLLAQARLDEGLDEDVADLGLTRALAAEHRGDMALMRECNEATLRVAIAGNIEVAASHCIAHMNLYTAALHRGELEAAYTHATRAIEIANAWPFSPYRLFASFLVCNLHVMRGDLEAAGEFLRGLPPTWADGLNWHNGACAYTVVGYYHRSLGDWEAAEAALKRGREIFERAGFREGCKVPLEHHLWLLVQRRQFARVEGLAAEFLEPDSRSIYDLALVLPRARARHLKGDPAAALALLETATGELERQEARLMLARARYFEAASRLAQGDPAGAEQAYAMAEALVDAHGFGFLREQDPVLWEELKGLERPRPALATVEPMAASVPAAEVAVVAAPRARPVRAASAAEPLAIRCFGPLEVRRGGVLLDQWPRRKARMILAALALYPQGLRLAELAGVAGIEDLTPADVNTLQHDISALRRILEPGLKKGDASVYVRLVDDRYFLEAALVEEIDVAEFTRLAVAGDLARATDPLAASQHYEAAIAHYRANLLDEKYLAELFDGERIQQQQRALSVLGWLASFHQGRGDNTSAEAWLRRAVAIAPVDEAIHLTLMQHLVSKQRADLARLVYWDCRKALKAQLGLAPGPELETAYRALPAA